MKQTIEALELLVSLFEAWRDGIFKRAGLTWTSEPPAIINARGLIAAYYEDINE